MLYIFALSFEYAKKIGDRGPATSALVKAALQNKHVDIFDIFDLFDNQDNQDNQDI